MAQWLDALPLSIRKSLRAMLDTCSLPLAEVAHTWELGLLKRTRQLPVQRS